jgi:hypothetical protein
MGTIAALEDVKKRYVTKARQPHDDAGEGCCRRVVLPGSPDQSRLILASRITWLHISVSSAMNLVKSTGEEADTVRPGR